MRHLIRLEVFPVAQGTIVIVDDDPAVLEGLRFALEAEGYLVETYQKAAHALARGTFPVNCCFVLDYYLDDMTGIELFARLRSAGSARPALIITPFASQQIREQAKNAGMSVVEKPFASSELSDRIRTLLASTKGS